MPRYIVEREFPDGLSVPPTSAGAEACLSIVQTNAHQGVTWLHSYVTPERTRTFCVYDAPSPEAIRTAARHADLPIDRISEVRVLDPYFYLEH